MTLGSPRLHLLRTDSTNERARALARRGAPHGTLMTAGEQTAGRGRQGRSWSAPPGRALLMSVVLRDPPAMLPLLAAVAVCEAVDGVLAGCGATAARASPDAAARRARIKWPNDIVLERPGGEPFAGEAAGEVDGQAAGPALAKVAGILAEGRLQEGWAILGVGVNVAVRSGDLPPELRGRAGTLGLEPGAVEQLLVLVLDALSERLRTPAAEILSAWRERDALLGREVRWEAGRGVAAGVDGGGRLVVARADGGRTTLDAGEVHLLAATREGSRRAGH